MKRHDVEEVVVKSGSKVLTSLPLANFSKNYLDCNFETVGLIPSLAFEVVFVVPAAAAVDVVVVETVLEHSELVNFECHLLTIHSHCVAVVDVAGSSVAAVETAAAAADLVAFVVGFDLY